MRRRRRCASPASRRPSASASTRYLTLERLREQLAVGKPAPDDKQVRSRPRPSAGCPRCRSRSTTTSTPPARSPRGTRRLQLANRVLDGKLDAPKDVKRRTLERLARDLVTASQHLGLGLAEPRAWLDAHRARRCALARHRRRRSRGADRQAQRSTQGQGLRRRRRAPRRSRRQERRDHGHAPRHHLARPKLTAASLPTPSAAPSCPCAPCRRASR